MHGRTFEFSNKAKLHISFEGNIFTLNEQEYSALKKLLDVLDEFRKSANFVERSEKMDVSETSS